MEKVKEKPVLNTDPDIVEYRTNIEGWVGKDGRFYGKNESAARYANSTHKQCSCGDITSKHRTECESCWSKKSLAKYYARPEIEWDGETPLYSEACDEYFYDADAISEYSIDEGIDAAEMMFVVCVPNYLTEFSTEQWDDVLPEDGEVRYYVSKEVLEKLDELNKLIRNAKPVSWGPGKHRTSVAIN